MEINSCSSAEEEFAKHFVNEEHVSFWGAITGFRASSTRTELAAGIIAATAGLGVHQATDSMAYCTKRNKLLQGKNLTRRRPWNLHKDGDLWESMYQILLAKPKAADL